MSSEFNINDLMVVEQIIRACQQRGSFRAEEMLPIGTLYQKILKILKADQDRQEQSKNQTRMPSIEEEKIVGFDR
jgi:hypothetical protein